MVEPTSAESPGFYAALPVFDRFSDVYDPARYSRVPLDWDVVVTDVEGSTKAIEAGRYKDVNAAGVASIVALRNALPEFDLPFVFGGDGATVLTPASQRERVRVALRGIRVMAKEALGMTMRASMVPVAELDASSCEVRVARFGASPNATFAMFLGSGLSEAERRIKDPTEGPRYAVSGEGPSEASFDGFECRWKPLDSRRGKVVSLLVQQRSRTCVPRCPRCDLGAARRCRRSAGRTGEPQRRLAGASVQHRGSHHRRSVRRDGGDRPDAADQGASSRRSLRHGSGQEDARISRRHLPR